VGKVKGFKVTGEAEQKMTNEESIKLIKGAINHVDINYNRFDIMHCKIVTKQMVKHWAFVTLECTRQPAMLQTLVACRAAVVSSRLQIYCVC